MMAVLIGIDGSGKSTVAERVAARLSENGYPTAVCWARWQPFLLRPMRALVRGVAFRQYRGAGKDEPTEVSDLKAAVFGQWRLVARAYLMLALLDYWLQAMPRLLLASLRSRILLLDRYWYDLIVDAMGNAVSQTDLDAGLRHWWRRCFPTPELVVLLDVDPSTAYARKGGENPLSYLATRRATYATVIRVLGGQVVDASRPIAEVCREVEEAVIGRRDVC